MKIQTFLHFPEVTSTNTVLAALVESTSAKLPAVIMADRQTAGRGRDGRPWASPPGCLTFTLAFSDETIALPVEKTPLLGLAAGLAVRDAVRELIPAVEKVGRLGIHWPNDVCLMVPGSEKTETERKLCGILIERLASGVFIMGIGVNVHNSYENAPPEFQNRLFSLADIARKLGEKEYARVSEISCRDVLDVILTKMACCLAELQADSVKMVKMVNACCLQKGHFTMLSTPQGAVSGLCTGLAEDGRILLDGKAYHTGEFPASYTTPRP